MDIKDLNKPQLILLAVLLSFITSIATGITTVTLMQQAPVSFTAPVNRVIQQTVEKIQQVEGKTTVQTVVVKEEDLVVDAIAKNKLSIFLISKEVIDDSGQKLEVNAGRGFAVNSNGIVAVDGGQVFDKGVYYVKNESGKFKADFLGADKGGFSLLKIGDPVDGKSKVVFNVPTFGDIDKMKIGQKIILLGSNITSLIYEGNKDIKLTVTKGNAGGMVLDLDGNIIGMAVSGDPSFVPISDISTALKAFSTAGSTTLPVASPVLAPGVTPSGSNQ